MAGKGGPTIYAPQPQHPIPPMNMRSPPIEQQQQQQPYGASPYTQQAAYNAYGQQQTAPGGGGGMPHGPNAGFPGQEYWNAPAAQMGLQVGQQALSASQAYVNQNVSRWISIASLRKYFQVTNAYVLRKLLLVLFPWRHHPWHRQVTRDGSGQVDGFADPKDDLNAPDMYIPIMASVTYVLLNSLIAGIQGAFQADLLGTTAGWAGAFLLVENLLIKLGCYLLNIPSTFFLDLVAYSGYKYLGIIVTNLVGLLNPGRTVYWLTFLYTGLGVAFFMLRSLRSAILQGTEDAMGRSGKARRVYFLAGIAAAQLLWMYLMLK
ncbi:YIF1-domain-containing protein [Protomyces lactucae-debilis]|uniref:Protein YIF1 n=1 Tax=Protomyces lactucae-debilis TaxID=2754530 RepID=A0A1Y2FC38_PROLT|nr:YIF1-domain-containing protein [Protomyces lactucae-debilis]ORY81488.1 YIF1-domain-containing protein [Protomyces lactucae-debilis]